jgi:hypothetical protein
MIERNTDSDTANQITATNTPRYGATPGAAAYHAPETSMSHWPIIIDGKVNGPAVAPSVVNGVIT